MRMMGKRLVVTAWGEFPMPDDLAALVERAPMKNSVCRADSDDEEWDFYVYSVADCPECDAWSEIVVARVQEAAMAGASDDELAAVVAAIDWRTLRLKRDEKDAAPHNVA